VDGEGASQDWTYWLAASSLTKRRGACSMDSLPFRLANDAKERASDTGWQLRPQMFKDR